MAENFRWASNRPRLRAEIDNIRFDGVVSFSSAYELDNIPSATLTLPTGREMHTGELAPVHTQYAALRHDAPVKVFLRFEDYGRSADAPKNTWPEGEFVIFDGYVAASNIERTEKSSAVVVHLAHWLTTLNESSALSATSQPGNPAAWTFAASNMIQSDSGQEVAGWLPTQTTAITSAAVLEDLWARVLLPVLKAIAGNETMDIFAGDSFKTNTAAQARIKAVLEKFTTTGKDYVPLSMDIHSSAADTISNNISKSIQSEQLSGWIHTTLWGKLVGDWGPKFGFSICPRISDCLVIPQVGALNGDTFATFTTDDYLLIRDVSASSQQIQAVGIVGSAVSDTGATPTEQPKPAQPPPLIGVFPADPAKRGDGMIILKGTPDWLSDPVNKERFSRRAAGVEKDGQNAIPSALDPTNQQLIDKSPADDVSEFLSSGIVSRWAQHLYINEKLRGCVMELVGRFRLDLAPGSTVKVQLPGDKYDESIDNFGSARYATVARVQHTIDAANARMNTSFLLTHVRTSQEHSDENQLYAAAKPPLYTTAWRGAPFLPL